MDSVTALENKDYVKFLWVLIDKHLTWKQHSDYNSSKSKIIGPIARLRHRVPIKTLIEIYPSLTFSYLYCGIAAWGQTEAIKLAFKQLHGNSFKTPLREQKIFGALEKRVTNHD